MGLRESLVRLAHEKPHLRVALLPILRAADEALSRLKVGDILYSSWGYDQTNIDFYEVVEVKAKAVVIRKIESKVVRRETGADYVVAVPHKFTSPPMVKIPRDAGSLGVAVRINAYSSAFPWDGKPKYETGAGWGH